MMAGILHDLKDIQEHANCPHSSQNNDASMIEILNIPMGQGVDREVGRFEIILIISGEILLSKKGIPDRNIKPQHMFLLSPGDVVVYSAVLDSSIVICRLNNTINYCRFYNSDELKEYLSSYHWEGLHIVPIKQPVRLFTRSLTTSVESGLRCKTYLQAKYTELMFLLRRYYLKAELVGIFRPLLGKDIELRTVVYQHVHECKSVKELAEKCYMSEVGFRKRFVTEMGISPKEFLLETKKHLIHNEIVNGDKPFKQICEEYGISTQQDFSRFCKARFGETPSNIRKETAKKVR